MTIPATAMLAVFLLVCLVVPSVLYIRKRRHYVDLIADDLAADQLRREGYQFLVLKKYRRNVYAFRPGARSKEEVHLEARHQKSTNLWNMIEYSLVVYGRRPGQPSGRQDEIFQCDWTEERQLELRRFVERFNLAVLSETTEKGSRFGPSNSPD